MWLLFFFYKDINSLKLSSVHATRLRTLRNAGTRCSLEDDLIFSRRFHRRLFTILFQEGMHSHIQLLKCLNRTSASLAAFTAYWFLYIPLKSFQNTANARSVWCLYSIIWTACVFSYFQIFFFYCVCITLYVILFAIGKSILERKKLQISCLQICHVGFFTSAEYSSYHSAPVCSRHF